MCMAYSSISHLQPHIVVARRLWRSSTSKVTRWMIACRTFLQARSDAQKAVDWFRVRQSAQEIGADNGEEGKIEASCAFLRLGQAFVAEQEHQDQDACEAAKVAKDVTITAKAVIHASLVMY